MQCVLLRYGYGQNGSVYADLGHNIPVWERSGRSFHCYTYSYGYNGKEKENEISEGDLDFGARIYDGKIGRWLSVDPMQAKYPSLSPYNFCANNPIMFVDPDGNRIILGGKKKDKDSFINIVNNNCTNVSVTVNDNGLMVVTDNRKEVTTEINGEKKTEKIGTLTPYEQALLDSYNNTNENKLELTRDNKTPFRSKKEGKNPQILNITTLENLSSLSYDKYRTKKRFNYVFNCRCCIRCGRCRCK